MRQEQDKRSKSPAAGFLPLIAVIMVVLALVVVIFVPKNTGSGDKSAGTSGETGADAPAQTADAVAELNEDGDLMIYADRLSSDKVSFIRVSENSRIELLARIGDDGAVKAALGTCQSCNGSPGAYYTQEGSELQCNNCGLTFPVSVLDSPGGGCHPIMLKEEIVQYDGNDMVIDLEGLSVYEELFARTADH